MELASGKHLWQHWGFLKHALRWYLISLRSKSNLPHFGMLFFAVSPDLWGWGLPGNSIRDGTENLLEWEIHRYCISSLFRMNAFTSKALLDSIHCLWLFLKSYFFLLNVSMFRFCSWACAKDCSHIQAKYVQWGGGWGGSDTLSRFCLGSTEMFPTIFHYHHLHCNRQY